MQDDATPTTEPLSLDASRDILPSFYEAILALRAAALQAYAADETWVSASSEAADFGKKLDAERLFGLWDRRQASLFDMASTPPVLTVNDAVAALLAASEDIECLTVHENSRNDLADAEGKLARPVGGALFVLAEAAGVDLVDLSRAERVDMLRRHVHPATRSAGAISPGGPEGPDAALIAACVAFQTASDLADAVNCKQRPVTDDEINGATSGYKAALGSLAACPPPSTPAGAKAQGRAACRARSFQPPAA